MQSVGSALLMKPNEQLHRPTSVGPSIDASSPTGHLDRLRHPHPASEPSAAPPSGASSPELRRSQDRNPVLGPRGLLRVTTQSVLSGKTIRWAPNNSGTKNRATIGTSVTPAPSIRRVPHWPTSSDGNLRSRNGYSDLYDQFVWPLLGCSTATRKVCGRLRTPTASALATTARTVSPAAARLPEPDRLGDDRLAKRLRRVASARIMD